MVLHITKDSKNISSWSMAPFSSVFTWFCSMGPDDGEGGGREVILDAHEAHSFPMTSLLPTPKPTRKQRLEPEFYQTAMGISHAQVIHPPQRLHSHLNSPWPHFNWNPSMVVKWSWEKWFNPAPFSFSCLQEECLFWWATVGQVSGHHQGKQKASLDGLDL